VISYIGAGTVVRGISSTLTAVPFRDNAGDNHLLCTGEFLGSQILATPSGWVLQSADNNAKQVKCFQFDSVGSTTIPSITWGSGSIAWAVLLTFTGLAPAASALDAGNDRAANTVSANIIGPAGTVTPAGDNELAILVGSKNKTSVSNGTSFTKPASSWDGVAVQSAPNGSTAAMAIAYWIQTTATAIAANSAIQGSIAETSGQAQQGSLFFLKAAAAIVVPSRTLLGVGV
jgi:hypothetical protein